MENIPAQEKIFNIMKTVIFLAVIVLVIVNVLYIFIACMDKQCTIVNFFTIALLLWATALWIVVLKYSKKYQ
jgi:hypothetical protein